ncbi:MAG: transposase [Lentisphaeria bacterium]|nr:transposase [Lentisphaeria bacterium]
MPRPQIENCCVHVTHRCHRRQFLLDTDIDRKQYVKRLWEAKTRFTRVRILNYCVTSNHVHLLVWSPRMSDLSEMMKWLHGTFAGDYNRRHRREGAFWSGRFHSTLVQTGPHLQRCLFYLDMNMVRTRVVSHPGEWKCGGHHELAGTRKRYRIIDFSCLLSCLGLRDEAAFSDWYAGTLNNLCRLPVQPAEPFWDKAFAVGDKSWLQKLAGNDTDVDDLIAPADSGGAASEQSTWYLQATQGVLNRLKRHLSD